MTIVQERETPFLGLPESELTTWEESKVVIVPLPYEQTVSYGKGTGEGPRAILKASSQVELFDEELEMEPYTCGIFTLKELEFSGAKGQAAVELIQLTADKIVSADKFPLSLGGEHTITIGLIEALRKKYSNLHIVHLDAHADMRVEYEGTKWSHACIMHRVYEMGIPYTSIGIRAISKEEFETIRPLRKNYFLAHEIAKKDNWIEEALKTISGPVYLTVDIDVLDSGIIPHTGTPEPGGLNWYQLTDFLKKLIESREVVGADLVELAPNPNSQASDFTAAKLVYKIIGYLRF